MNFKRREIRFEAPAQDFREKNTKESILLRKTKRNEQVSTKRMMLKYGGSLISCSHFPTDLIPDSLYPSFPSLFSLSTSLSDYLSCFASCSDLNSLSFFTKGLCDMLESGKVLARDIPNGSVLKPIIRLLHMRKSIAEGLSCLINLTSEHLASAAVESGAVEAIVELLGSSSEENMDMCVWCLGNIAGDCINCRDAVIATGVAQRLVSLIKENKCRKNAVWCAANLCKGKPPASEYVRQIIRNTVVGLLKEKDLEIVKYAVEAVFYCAQITENEEKERELLERLCELTDCGEKGVEFLAVKTINNLVICEENTADFILEKGMLDKISEFLDEGMHNKSSEALLLLSNLCAEKLENTEGVIRHKAFGQALECIGDEYLTSDALWVVYNLSKKDEAQDLLVEKGTIQAVIRALAMRNPEFPSLALEILDLLLEKPENREIFESSNGLEALERLQCHPNLKVHQLAADLLAKHFSLLEE
jgi:hypothetical protein